MKLTITNIELFLKAVFNKKRRENKNNNTLIQNKQIKIDNVNSFTDNNRTLLVGPSFLGKTYLILKIYHECLIEIFR